jgi:hypothetical protein
MPGRMLGYAAILGIVLMLLSACPTLQGASRTSVPPSRERESHGGNGGGGGY